MVNQNLNPGTYGFRKPPPSMNLVKAVGLSQSLMQVLPRVIPKWIADNWRHTIMSYNQSSTYASSPKPLVPTNSPITLMEPLVGNTQKCMLPHQWSMTLQQLNTFMACLQMQTLAILAILNQYGLTIVDSDGVDTLDASAETTASIINLSPGSYSSIGTTTREAWRCRCSRLIKHSGGWWIKYTSIAWLPCVAIRN